MPTEATRYAIKMAKRHIEEQHAEVEEIGAFESSRKVLNPPSEPRSSVIRFLTNIRISGSMLTIEDRL